MNMPLSLLLPAPVLLVAAYRLFFHRLARVPGPRLAAVSGLWYAYHVRRGRLLPLARRLHAQYGPAVRVGPNEVWFSSEEAFRVIYGSRHGFEKSDFYLTTALFRPHTSWRRPFHLGFPDTLDLLSERDTERYRRQRRLLGPVYHAANVQKFGPAVDAVLDRVVHELRAIHKEGLPPLDLKTWMHIVAVECLGATVLSWSPGFVAARSDRGTSRVSYLNWRRKSVFGLFPRLVVLDLHCPWVGKLFAAVWRLGYTPPAGYKSFFPAVGQRVASRIKGDRSAQRQKRPPPPKNDLLADLLALHHARPAFSETYLRRLAVTNFGAGHETLCSALTACIAMLASHPAVFRKAADEVRALSTATTTTTTTLADATASAAAAALHLPYTTACVREAQRLHPALAMALPRTVPEGLETGVVVVLHGHRLPPGTTVGCSPPALHRNTALFGADADAFRPERWLEADARQRRLMDRCNLTWGGGARTCPGRFLAELVLYKTVVALVAAMEIEATVPADDAMESYFLSMMTGVTARFVPVGGDGAK